MSVLKVNQIQTANGVIMANLNSSGANIGFQLASTLAPAFSAYPSATGSIANITPTKVACNTEDFDTNSNFDSTTNYRFTPTVAGYYHISGSVGVYGFSAGSGQVVSYLYKNGSNYAQGARIPITGTSYEPQCPISIVMYLNGSTDYVELWAYQSSGGSATIDNGRLYTYFTGAMVRSA